MVEAATKWGAPRFSVPRTSLFAPALVCRIGDFQVEAMAR